MPQSVSMHQLNKLATTKSIAKCYEVIVDEIGDDGNIISNSLHRDKTKEQQIKFTAERP